MISLLFPKLVYASYPVTPVSTKIFSELILVLDKLLLVSFLFSFGYFVFNRKKKDIKFTTFKLFISNMLSFISVYSLFSLIFLLNDVFALFNVYDNVLFASQVITFLVFWLTLLFFNLRLLRGSKVRVSIFATLFALVLLIVLYTEAKEVLPNLVNHVKAQVPLTPYPFIIDPEPRPKDYHITLMTIMSATFLISTVLNFYITGESKKKN